MKTKEVKTRWIEFGLVVAILLLGSPASAADEVDEAIGAVNEAFEAAIGRADAAGVAALYTANGQALPPQSDVATGRPAIAGVWQAGIDAGIAGVSLETVEIEHHGNTAHEIGTFELRREDGTVLDRGKYVVIWKKEGDSWKLHRDIWNSSVAPATP
jgi:ketosteroid isomerase-like protein